MSRIDQIKALRAAVRDVRPYPGVHTTIEVRHRRQWPTLWRAIDAIINDHSVEFSTCRNRQYPLHWTLEEHDEAMEAMVCGGHYTSPTEGETFNAWKGRQDRILRAIELRKRMTADFNSELDQHIPLDGRPQSNFPPSIVVWT